MGISVERAHRLWICILESALDILFISSFLAHCVLCTNYAAYKNMLRLQWTTLYQEKSDADRKLALLRVFSAINTKQEGSYSRMITTLYSSATNVPNMRNEQCRNYYFSVFRLYVKTLHEAPTCPVPSMVLTVN